MLSTLLQRLRRDSKPPAPRQPPRPFQAVSIYRGLTCCLAAQKLSEQRFLMKHAPVLPLSSCTLPDRCECRYLKHKDRRTGERRLMDFSLASRLYAGPERRRDARRR
jgi:hypothetical protein